jgi:hypothetical protein
MDKDSLIRGENGHLIYLNRYRYRQHNFLWSQAWLAALSRYLWAIPDLITLRVHTGTVQWHSSSIVNVYPIEDCKI